MFIALDSSTLLALALSGLNNIPNDTKQVNKSRNAIL